MTKKNVVIIGAGFGGVEAARTLAKFSKIFNVTLVSKQESFIYYPALYKLTDKHSTYAALLKIGDMVPSNINIVYDEAISVSKETKTVSLVKGSDIKYDYIILALGSVLEDFGTPGVREFMCQFRSQDDIACLRGIIEKHKLGNHTEPIVVIGGGPTGVELAARMSSVFDKEYPSQKTTHNHVIIIEGSGSVVAQLPTEAREYIKQRLVDIGVGVYTDTRVTSYNGEILKTNTGEFLSHTVVWAAGLAAHPLLKELNVDYDKRGRVLVNQYLESTFDDSVFVIGDSASTIRAGLAQTAIYDGKFVAHSLHNKILNRRRKEYKAPEIGYAVPVGPKWGIASFMGVNFRGYLGYIIRNVIDFQYIFTHVNFSAAVRIFIRNK